nr:unnamed protein product [Spirometra erinaceieuropaei]
MWILSVGLDFIKIVELQADIQTCGWDRIRRLKPTLPNNSPYASVVFFRPFEQLWLAPLVTYLASESTPPPLDYAPSAADDNSKRRLSSLAIDLCPLLAGWASQLGGALAPMLPTTSVERAAAADFLVILVRHAWLQDDSANTAETRLRLLYCPKTGPQAMAPRRACSIRDFCVNCFRVLSAIHYAFPLPPEPPPTQPLPPPSSPPPPSPSAPARSSPTLLSISLFYYRIKLLKKRMP